MKWISILFADVTNAIDYLKSNRASSTDNMAGEIFTAAGEKTAQHTICNNIWKSVVWPQDWCRSTCIDLHKNKSHKKWGNYRTSSLCNSTR